MVILKHIRVIILLRLLGYYLTDKLAIGLQLGYTSTTINYLDFYSHNKVIDSLERFAITTKIFSIAPLLRYTIPVTDKFGINFNITIPYSYTKYTNSEPYIGSTPGGVQNGYINIPVNYTYTSYGLSISPGFQWFVKNKIAILGSLGALSYTHYKFEASQNTYRPAASGNTNDFKLSLSTSISLGVTFYFGGGK